MFSHRSPEPSAGPLEADETELFLLPGACYSPGHRAPQLGQFSLTTLWLRFTPTTTIAGMVQSGLRRGDDSAHPGEKIDCSGIERIERRRRLIFFQELVVTLRDGRILHLGGAQELAQAEQALRERINRV
jgi:hypothetical protein